MLVNRSIPRCTVIPELAYPDVEIAAAWLCKAFGFTLRIGMGDHRAQLNVGDGAVVLTKCTGAVPQDPGPSIIVRVDDADRHCEHSMQNEVRIAELPQSYPYGERQYTALDLVGRRWKFSQSIADVAPEEWGGIRGDLGLGESNES